MAESDDTAPAAGPEYASIMSRVAALEQEVRALKACQHVYETVGGRNTNYRTFFNMGNAYHRCIKCGHRERC